MFLAFKLGFKHFVALSAVAFAGSTILLMSMRELHTRYGRPPRASSAYLPGPRVFHNVLLIIIYHYPYYESVPLLLQFYGIGFQNITICGPEEPKKLNISIMTVTHERGYWGYECLAKAARENPQYDGYLQLHDDILFQWWNVRNEDNKKMWNFTPDMTFKTGAILGKPPPSNWPWWRKTNILERTADAFEELRNQSFTSHPWLKESFATFYNNSEFNGTQTIPSSHADIWYIPGHLAGKFSHLSSVFFKHKVFLESAVPTMMSFLADTKDIRILGGIFLHFKYGYGSKRDSPEVFWTQYRHNLPFIHPFKLHGENGRIHANILQELLIPYAQRIQKGH